MAQEDLFKKLVAHCKEYGFVFQSSEIYDGLAAVYDYGQYGVELKNNIRSTGGTPRSCFTKMWWDWILPYLCTPPSGKLLVMWMLLTIP